MNKYVQQLGMPNLYTFTDVWGLEQDMLALVPRPVAAVLLLYPISEKSEASMIGEVKEDKQNIYFLRQFIGNACGTIGLIHAILNNAETLNIKDDSHLSKFLQATKDMNAEERGKYLEKDKGFAVAHESSAQEGQTEAPPAEEHVKHHFVAFIHNSGQLYELDGRKNGPIAHGPTSPDSLLEDAAAVVRQFMARDPDEFGFTVVSLSMGDQAT